MKTKSRMRLEIKEISAEGYFEGLLSPYGNVDGGGDVVEPGAFTKTLKDNGNKVPMLWQHKTDLPIGELTLEDRPEGLWCKGQLLMADTVAQRAYLFIKSRIVKGLSIGFETMKDAMINGVRHLKEIKLYEGSIVTFPMNEAALIASVKGRAERKGDFNEELNAQQICDARYQILQALSAAISDTIWSDDLTREEKISLFATIWQQASDAANAWFPLYLDCLAEMYGAMETWSQKRLETKEGRKLSAATKETMKSACDQIAMGHKTLLALLEDEAGDADTTLPEGKAGRIPTSEPGAAAPKPEPAQDHSAAESLIGNIRALISSR